MPGSHFEFHRQYDKMLDLKGNTAIYLMYSYARICSIANKAGVKKVRGGRGAFAMYACVSVYICVCVWRKYGWKQPQACQDVCSNLSTHDPTQPCPEQCLLYVRAHPSSSGSPPPP